MSHQLERLTRIYNRLRRGPVTIEIISGWAKQAGINISDRQLYRDLSQLKDMMIVESESVIEYINENNKKTWKLEFQEDSDKLNTYDINTFFLMKNFTTFTVAGERKSSMEKFEKIFYQHFSKNNFQKNVVANSLYMRKTAYKENQFGHEEHKMIEDLIWGIQNNRMIIIEEDRIDATNFMATIEGLPVKMSPIELLFHRGRIFLSGWSEENQLLTFGLDKTFKFTLTNDTFNRKKILAGYRKNLDKLFGISKPIDDKVYDVQLEFTSGYGEGMKTYSLHHSQKWEKLANGNYMLHLKCAITRELVGFISYGLDKVKVHQPKILIDLIIQKYRDSLDIYERDLSIDEVLSNVGY